MHNFQNSFSRFAILVAVVFAGSNGLSQEMPIPVDQTIDAAKAFPAPVATDASDDWLTGDWDPHWSDEFDGSGKLDADKWHFFTPELAQRNETAYFTDSHAFRENGRLVMEAVTVDGRAEMSFIRSFDDMSPGWDRGFPDGNDFLLDPTKGPLYVETSVRFDKATPAFRSWWAFWLLSPNVDWLKGADGEPRIFAHYDGVADTGSEVDIFEYVPDVTSNGFNAAIHRSQTSTDGAEKSTRPDDRPFTVENLQKKYGLQLDDGKFHKIGFYYSVDRYAFYLDGVKFWELTEEKNPGWITKQARNGILLSWEADNLSPWGRPIEKNEDGTRKTFVTENTNAKVYVDYVRVFRKSE